MVVLGLQILMMVRNLMVERGKVCTFAEKKDPVAFSNTLPVCQILQVQYDTLSYGGQSLATA